MAELARFWMVWDINGSSPRVRHGSKAKAITEAKRLAELSPGRQFIVLAAVGAFAAEIQPVKPVKLIDPDFAEVDDDEIPF